MPWFLMYMKPAFWKPLSTACAVDFLADASPERKEEKSMSCDR